jgi:hypothetical protein
MHVPRVLPINHPVIVVVRHTGKLMFSTEAVGRIVILHVNTQRDKNRLKIQGAESEYNISFFIIKLDLYETDSINHL